MKLNTAVAKSLLMAASIGMVVPLFAQTPAKPKTTKPATPPVEEPAKIEGVEIARSNGTFLGVTVEGPRLVVKFYKADKKPMKADVSRATARWSPVNKKGDERSVLNSGDGGLSLTSTPTVKPPLVFMVYMTLLDAEGNAVESFVVDMRKLNASPGQ